MRGLISEAPVQLYHLACMQNQHADAQARGITDTKIERRCSSGRANRCMESDQKKPMADEMHNAPSNSSYCHELKTVGNES